jgi:cation diffusion facilitator family transporter
MNENKLSPRQKAGQRVGFVGLFTNLLLFAGKFFAGTVSNSIAIIADSFNNLADCASAAVTIIGFKFAARKRDIGHPYGHGRGEYIAGFIMSMLILLTAYTVAEASISRLVKPEDIEFSVLPIVVGIVAILVKIGLAIYARYSNKKVNSKVLDATMMDSFSDCLATALSLLPLFLIGLTDLPVDGILGIILSLFIAWSGFGIFWSNMNLILGQGLTKSEHKKIHDIVDEFDVFGRISAMDVHDYGPEARILLVKVHLAAPPHSEHFEYELTKCKKELRDQLGFEEVILYWPPSINKN